MALSTTIPPTFDKKMVNFGPLTTQFMWLMSTHPKSTVCVISDNYTAIANISGMDQAINKERTAPGGLALGSAPNF